MFLLFLWRKKCSFRLKCSHFIKSSVLAEIEWHVKNTLANAFMYVQKIPIAWFSRLFFIYFWYFVHLLVLRITILFRSCRENDKVKICLIIAILSAQNQRQNWLTTALFIASLSITLWIFCVSYCFLLAYVALDTCNIEYNQ